MSLPETLMLKTIPHLNVFSIVIMFLAQVFCNNLLFVTFLSGRLSHFVFFPTSVESYLVLFTRILIFSLIFKGTGTGK